VHNAPSSELIIIKYGILDGRDHFHIQGTRSSQALYYMLITDNGDARTLDGSCDWSNLIASELGCSWPGTTILMSISLPY
jgi:hypothetical protein